jgi:hypothetical protein
MKKLTFLLLALPLTAGIRPQASAQTQSDTPANLSAYEIAPVRTEQALSRKVIPYDPKLFDRYLGYYQNSKRPDEIFTIRRKGNMFFSELPTQPDVSIFPESDTEFFATAVDAQLSFDIDQKANVTGLVLYQHGREIPFKKIDDAPGKKIVRDVEVYYSGVRKCWEMSTQPLLCAMVGEPN